MSCANRVPGKTVASAWKYLASSGSSATNRISWAMIRRSWVTLAASRRTVNASSNSRSRTAGSTSLRHEQENPVWVKAVSASTSAPCAPKRSVMSPAAFSNSRCSRKCATPAGSSSGARTPSSQRAVSTAPKATVSRTLQRRHLRRGMT